MASAPFMMDMPALATPEMPACVKRETSLPGRFWQWPLQPPRARRLTDHPASSRGSAAARAPFRLSPRWVP